MNFLSVFKHLLPRGLALDLTDEKPLRSFFEGLSFAFIKLWYDILWLDIFPATTRHLDLWETQLGLSRRDQSEAVRRERLDAAWKAMGGHSPRAMQDELQANGFDVYVHDWWEPLNEPPVGVHMCLSARSPLDALGGTPPLVNKIPTLSEKGKPPARVECGEPVAEAGEPIAECGNWLPGAVEIPARLTDRIYETPDDASKWQHFIYVGAATFPDYADVDNELIEDLEDLVLKIRPLSKWVGMLINPTYPNNTILQTVAGDSLSTTNNDLIEVL